MIFVCDVDSDGGTENGMLGSMFGGRETMMMMMMTMIRTLMFIINTY